MAVDSVRLVQRRPVIRTIATVLLVCAGLAIAIARVAEPRNTVMVAAAGLAPLAAIGCGLAIALSASVLAGRESATFRWLLGLAVALTAIHLWWFGPLVVGGQPPRPPGALTETVMSVNMLGGRADAGQIVQTARTHGVDILVITEITDAALGRLDAAGIGRVLPSRVGRTGSYSRGTMVFARGRILASRPIGTQAAGYVVTTRVGARRVVLVAAHPVAPDALEAWVRDLRVVGDAARSSGADMVMGDFNATLDHRPFRTLLQTAGLRDAAELANVGWEATFPANWIRRRLGIPVPAFLQLDHVLVRDDGGASSVRTVAIDGTDHLGVLAEVWLPATAHDLAP